MAMEYLGISDLVLAGNFQAFMHNPGHIIDLSPPGEGESFCSLNHPGGDKPSNCRRRYFIAGDPLIITPELLNDASFPAADIILASNHRGFLLEFDSGDSSMRFNGTSECRSYFSRYWWTQIGGVRLCVGSSGPNELQARRSPPHPPVETRALHDCLTQDQWNLTFWQASLRVRDQLLRDRNAVTIPRGMATQIGPSR